MTAAAVASDMVRTVTAMAGGPRDIFAEPRDRYRVLATRQIVVASSALWAIQSNARQHAFVKRVIEKYINARPGMPAQNALVATRPR